MKTLYKITNTLTAILLTVVLIACTKDNDNNKHKGRIEATAVVIDGGNPAADGCGWLIRVGATNYSPDNLPENFKINNINVQIIYTVSDAKFACGFNNSGPNFIHLYDIKR